jgi:hypothetical protein
MVSSIEIRSKLLQQMSLYGLVYWYDLIGFTGNPRTNCTTPFCFLKRNIKNFPPLTDSSFDTL